MKIFLDKNYANSLREPLKKITKGCFETQGKLSNIDTQ